MTERKEALKELLAKVEAETVDDWRDFMRGIGFEPDERVSNAWDAYQGSLDAAKALHEAVLDGWDWLLSTRDEDESEKIISIAAKYEPEGDVRHEVEATSQSPSRAWLIAILKALIEQETPQ